MQVFHCMRNIGVDKRNSMKFTFFQERCMMTKRMTKGQHSKHRSSAVAPHLGGTGKDHSHVITVTATQNR